MKENLTFTIPCAIVSRADILWNATIYGPDIHSASLYEKMGRKVLDSVFVLVRLELFTLMCYINLLT